MALWIVCFIDANVMEVHPTFKSYLNQKFFMHANTLLGIVLSFLAIKLKFSRHLCLHKYNNAVTLWVKFGNSKRLFDLSIRVTECWRHSIYNFSTGRGAYFKLKVENIFFKALFNTGYILFASLYCKYEFRSLAIVLRIGTPPGKNSVNHRN